MSKKIASAVTKIVEQLEGLQNGEERLRAVSAALTVFGEQLSPSNGRNPPSLMMGDNAGKPQDSAIPEIHARGQAWASKHGISSLQLEQFFHAEDGHVRLIVGEPIGRGKREQTINTYVLTGLAALLETGSSAFSDEAARANCTSLGCYDIANHAAYLKDVGNRITGNKKSGWTITGPGLTAAAKLLQPAQKDTK